MRTDNIFIAHPTTVDQINALKAVVKAFNVKFEIRKEPFIEDDVNSKSKVIDSVKQGFKEMKEIQEGKKVGSSLKDFLNEL